jgi:DNA-binding LacI/PurR family transcriptional regulator
MGMLFRREVALQHYFMSDEPLIKSISAVNSPIATEWKRPAPDAPFSYLNVQGFLGLGNEFIAAMVGGMLEGCNVEDRDLVLQRAQDAEQYKEKLLSGAIAGLVLHAYHAHPIVKSLAASGLPVVAVCDAIPEFPSIVVDDLGGGRLLAHYLCDRGYRQILYRRKRHDIESSQRRFDGFMEVAKTRELDVTISVIDDDFVLAPEEIVYLSDVRHHPCAVTGWRDLSLMAVAKFCREFGLGVPGQVALAGFDGLSLVPQVSGILTTIVAPWSELAKTSITVLAAILRNKQVPKETVIPVRLRIGDTT